jgi:flagellar hook-associated protein 3 FlgL
VNASAQTADSALQTASNLVDQLRSIAAEGATGTATATTRTELAQQVQQIGQQLVSIANTTVQGQYIFGGDASSTAPYTYQWSATGMAVSNSTAGSTQIVRDASGDQIVPSMTAQQIFDTANSDGTPGVFQTVFNLGQALSTNNQTGIQTAATALEDSVTQVGQAGSFYGNVENWIQRANTDASDRLVSLQQQLSSLRDTDVAGAATQLTLDQTAYQAAIQAQASLPTKTLFDYVG